MYNPSKPINVVGGGVGGDHDQQQQQQQQQQHSAPPISTSIFGMFARSLSSPPGSNNNKDNKDNKDYSNNYEMSSPPLSSTTTSPSSTTSSSSTSSSTVVLKIRAPTSPSTSTSPNNSNNSTTSSSSTPHSYIPFLPSNTSISTTPTTNSSSSGGSTGSTIINFLIDDKAKKKKKDKKSSGLISHSPSITNLKDIINSALPAGSGNSNSSSSNSTNNNNNTSGSSSMNYTNINGNNNNNNNNNNYQSKEKKRLETLSMLERNKVGQDDLSEMKETDDDSLVNNLQVRFKKNIIYTNIGPILVSINPYQKIGIYTTDILNIYKQRNGIRLPPHLFSVAENSYLDMIDFHRNQVICISGESGSGKSENNKLIIQCLLGAAPSHKRTNIENLILESGPILESFGHCITVSNNNSSRFGKYVEIYYSSYGDIKGARIYNYFLDESRVTYHNKGERNFHIFYQFLMGTTEEEKVLYGLSDINSYHYLNQGGLFAVDEIDDQKNFERLRMAFSFFDFTSHHIDLIFRTLAFIINLGNLNFTQTKTKIDIKDRQYLETISNSISYDQSKLEFIFIPDKNTTLLEAIENRDSLAKSLYTNLFQWIVDILNLKLSSDSHDHIIGLLDLFGQENTQLNGYEQFSINFLEEQLQQIYIQNILKNEQEEYKKERINWNTINFKDNLESLALLEMIVNLLDQESKNPQSNDTKFLDKLNLFLGKHRLYYMKQKKFGVEHFFGTMFYDIKGFIQKNRDEIYQKSSNLYKCSIIKAFSDTTNNNLKTSRRSPLSIIKSLPQNSNFHFIKCLRPNSKKLPNQFDSKIVNDQIKTALLVESTKIQKHGFTTSYPKTLFYERFPFFKQDPSKGLLDKMKDNGIQIDTLVLPVLHLGASNTKFYFRYGLGQLLEVERQKRRYRSSIVIQKTWRMYRERKAYLAKKQATLVFQKCTRRWLVQRRYLSIRQAIIILESFSRMVIHRVRYLRLKSSSTSLQSHLRGLLAKDYVTQLLTYNNHPDKSSLSPPVIPQSLIVHNSPCSTPPTSPTLFYMQQKEGGGLIHDHHHHHNQHPHHTSGQRIIHDPHHHTNQHQPQPQPHHHHHHSKRKEVRFSDFADCKEPLTPTTSTTPTKPFIRPSSSRGVPPLMIGTTRKEQHLSSSPSLTPISSPNSTTPSDSSPPYSPPVSPKKDQQQPSPVINSTEVPPPSSSSSKTKTKPPPLNIFDHNHGGSRPQMITSSKNQSTLSIAVNSSDQTPPSSSLGSKSSKGTSPREQQSSPSISVSSSPSTTGNNSSQNRSRTYSLNLNSRANSTNSISNSSAIALTNKLSEPVSPGKGPSINPVSPRLSSVSPRNKFPPFVYFPSASPSVKTPSSLSRSYSSIGGGTPKKPELVPPQLPIYKTTTSTPLINAHLSNVLSPRRRSKSIIVKESDAEEFLFIDYAKQNFEQRSKKSLIRKRNVSYDMLVSFAKKLSSPLHKFNDPNLEKLSLDIFNHILMYMGDQERKKSLAATAIYIVKTALEHIDLRDEVYCQLVKQITRHPKRENKIKGWELFSICCGSFPPNQRLLKYISSFLLHRSDTDDDGFAQISFNRLESISRLGPRSFPPIESEIEAVRTKVMLRVLFQFPDDVGEQVEVDSTTTAGEVTERLTKMAGLRTDIHVASVYEIHKNKERSLRKNEFIMDVVSKWESYYQSVNLYNLSHGVPNSEVISLEPFQFCFKIQLYLKPTKPICSNFDQHILYHQLIKGISKGYLPINEDNLAKLAALRLQNDVLCRSNPNSHSDVWQRYIPEKLLLVHSPVEWSDIVQSKYREYQNYFRYLSLEDLRGIIVNFIMSLPFYGSTVFLDCTQDQWSEVEISGAFDGFHVVIDINGVHLISKSAIDSKKMDEFLLDDDPNIPKTPRSINNTDDNVNNSQTPNNNSNVNSNNNNNQAVSSNNNSSEIGSGVNIIDTQSDNNLSGGMIGGINSSVDGSSMGLDSSLSMDNTNAVNSLTRLLIGKPKKTFKVIETFKYSQITSCDIEQDGKTISLTVGSEEEDLVIQSPQCSEMAVLINGYLAHLSADSKSAIAIRDYSIPSDPFSFKKGNYISITERGEFGWCTGTVKQEDGTNGIVGSFPLEYVRILIGPNAPTASETPVVSRASHKKNSRSAKNVDGQSNSSIFSVKPVELYAKHPLMPYAINRYRSITALKLGDNLKHTSNLSETNIFISDLPLELQKEIVQLFSEIMKYMGDLPLHPKERKSRLLQNIIQRCINKPRLRDDIYFFICRQLTLNPDNEGIRKGILLFSLCAGCFPATAEFFPYIRQFLTALDNKYTKQCIVKLQATSLKGPRLYGPSKKETHAAKENRSMVIKIHLANGPPRQIEIGPSTTAHEALKMILTERLDVTYWKEFAIYKDWNGKEQYIKDHEKLADVIKLFEDMEKKTKKSNPDESPIVGRLVLLRKLWIPHTSYSMSNSMLELMFYQCVHDVLAGKTPGMTIERALKLAAYQLQAQEGDYNPECPLISEETVALCVPATLISRKTLSDWAHEINKAHSQLVPLNIAPQLALTSYLEDFSTLPYSGTTWFSICLKRNQGPITWIGINQTMIVQFDEKMDNELDRWAIEEVSGFTYREDSFSFLIGDLINPTRKLFYTDQGDEINEIFEVFKSLPKIDLAELERIMERKNERKREKEKKRASKLEKEKL